MLRLPWIAMFGFILLLVTATRALRKSTVTHSTILR